MNKTEGSNYVLITAIVNYGLGSKVLKTASLNGVPGGVIFLGKGTAKNKILQFLELAEIRKEIVFMVADTKTAATAAEKLEAEFEFSKPYKGIMFTTPMSAFISGIAQSYAKGNIMGNKKASFISIITIVDKARGEFVMDAANEAGARGGTIIKAKGSGAKEAEMLFQLKVDPEKEIVLIISNAASFDKIVNNIYERLAIGKAGNGVIFCLDVDKTYGLT